MKTWVQHTLSILTILLICLLFFYPIFKGNIPFPGDLLVGNNAPYNSYEHNGYAPGAVPHKAQGRDVITQMFPWKYFITEEIKKGSIPFWIPYNFSGNEFMANFQSGIFYPVSIIFLLFSFPVAWSLYIFLGPFLAAVFLYFLLKEYKLSSLASVFGGVLFAFSSYMTVWLEYGNITHTLLWLPLSLLITEKLLKEFKAKYLLLLVLTLVCSFLAGYIQGYFYMIVTIFGYYALRLFFEERFSFKRISIFTVTLLFPFFLTLFQLLPTIILFLRSTRGNYSQEMITYLLNPVWYVITSMIPDFFGNPASRNQWFDGTYIERVSFFGFIPFLLALVSMGEIKRRKEVTVYTIIFLTSLIFSANILLIPYLYRIPFPIISTTVPTRLLCIFVFAGSVLAAFGFEALLKNKSKKSIIVASLLGISTIVLSWGFVLFGSQFGISLENLSVTKRNLYLPSLYILIFSFCAGIFYFIIKQTRISTYITFSLLLVLFGVSMFDVFRFFHKITPFAPVSYIYPQTPVVTFLQEKGGYNRFWGYGEGYINSNFQIYDKTYSPEGYDAIHIKEYTEFLTTSKDGSIPSFLPRPDANIASGFGPHELRDNPYRQKVLNLLGIKYVLNKNNSLIQVRQPDTDTFPQERYTLVWQSAPWQVYENFSALPRTFVTGEYIVRTDRKSFFNTFYEMSFNPRQTLILDKKIAQQPDSSVVGSAAIMVYEPNYVVIQATASAQGLLFLSDTYSPDWKASIDGKETPVIRADYSFRAITLPKGEHEVIFYYNSKDFRNGLVISAISLIVFIGFLYSIWRKEKLL